MTIDHWLLFSWAVTNILVSLVMLGVIIGAFMNLRAARRRRQAWLDGIKTMIHMSDDELRRHIKRQRRGDHEDSRTN